MRLKRTRSWIFGVAAAVAFVGSPGYAAAAAYRLIVESNADAAAGAEVYAVTYNTFADFLNSPPGGPGGGGYSGVNISPDFSIAGLAFEPSAPTIPEPTTVLLIGIGLAGLGVSRPKRARGTPSRDSERAGWVREKWSG